MARTIYILITISLAHLAGCSLANQGQGGPIIPNSIGLVPNVDFSRLDIVLSKVVTRDRLVSWIDLDENIGTLDAQLALLAITGPSASPSLLPTEESRLAYWYNARTAWALKLVKTAGLPREIANPAAFNGRQFKLDGKLMSLADIDAILAGDSCWQSVISAPCVCFERAALPRRAFQAENIRCCIAERFQEFIADNRRVVIDVDHSRVLVPPVIWPLRDGFIHQYEQDYHVTGTTFLTALLPHLTGDALRKMQDIAGYQVQLRPPPLHIALTGKFEFWPKR
jgi:hypothetical protein